MADKEMLGLPGEMSQIINGSLKSINGTGLEDLFKKVKKLNRQHQDGKVDQAKYEAKIAEIVNELVYEEGTNRLSLMSVVSSKMAELQNLFKRRQDLQFVKYDPTKSQPEIDVQTLLARTIEARMMANSAQAMKSTEASKIENVRDRQRVVEPVQMNFSPLICPQLQPSPKNSSDRKFMDKYFARIRTDSGSEDVLKWDGKPYSIPSWAKNSGMSRSEALNSIPDDLKDSLDREIHYYVDEFKRRIQLCSPENERYLNPDPLEEFTDADKKAFVDQFQLEKHFIDFNNPDPIPFFIATFIKNINRVGSVEIVKKGKEIEKKYHWTHYEVELEDNYSQKPRPDYYVNQFFSVYADKFKEWNKMPVQDPKLMTNSRLELANYYFQIPEVEKNLEMNNDELLLHCLDMLPKTTRDFYGRKFHLETAEGREMFGRLAFFIASVLDASNTSAQSLGFSNSGGTGKTFVLCDIMGSWMADQVGKHFLSKPANSEFFTEKFQNRTGVFDSVLTVIDEYDGHSAYDDRSWYKVTTGSNGEDSELSVTSLRENNQLKNTAHMKFVFCTNNNEICLPSRGARRRTVPVEMKKKEYDGWCQETLRKVLKKEMPEFVKAAFTYYYNTELQDESGYYFITTPEDYQQYLEDGKLRFKTTEEMADYAFLNDSRFNDVYIITGAGCIANAPFYQEFIESTFDFDSNASMSYKDFMKTIRDAYVNNREAQAQELLELSEDRTTIKATKGSKLQSLKRWMQDQYQEEALGHQVKFSRRRIDGKPTDVVMGLVPKKKA